MSVEIYYFSGTGNSLAVARDIAANLEGRCLSIPSLMEREPICVEAEVLGFVFPVYHKSIPLILKRFVEKLADLDKKYLFSVSTYGDTPGQATPHLQQLLQSRGGQLAAGFGVHLPYNYLTPSWSLKDFFGTFTLREVSPEQQQILFEQAQKKIAEITTFVRARQTGTYEMTHDIVSRLLDSLNLSERLAKSVWLKIAGVEEVPDLPFLESRQLMGRAFHADEQCVGCGICARICPLGNISMVDGRPVWHEHCEQCFACLQWCPQSAVQFGAHTTAKRRYHHPQVKLAEMLKAAAKD